MKNWAFVVYGPNDSSTHCAQPRSVVWMADTLILWSYYRASLRRGISVVRRGPGTNVRRTNKHCTHRYRRPKVTYLGRTLHDAQPAWWRLRHLTCLYDAVERSRLQQQHHHHHHHHHIISDGQNTIFKILLLFSKIYIVFCFVFSKYFLEYFISWF